jgi:hypothetical protein
VVNGHVIRADFTGWFDDFPTIAIQYLVHLVEDLHQGQECDLAADGDRTDDLVFVQYAGPEEEQVKVLAESGNLGVRQRPAMTVEQGELSPTPSRWMVLYSAS